jgi:hypothetical protein
MNPPSPTKATHCLSGYAIWAAIAYGKPHAIEASVPDTENFIPFLILMYRAAQNVLVPLSTEIIALSSNSSETAEAIICGLIS